jgi:hypothetical protein
MQHVIEHGGVKPIQPPLGVRRVDRLPGQIARQQVGTEGSQSDSYRTQDAGKQDTRSASHTSDRVFKGRGSNRK